MAKTKGEKTKASGRLARKWEKLSLVRSRVRKGKDWLKLPLTDSGEIILSTKALQYNFTILKCVLDEYHLALQDVDGLTEQASFFVQKFANHDKVFTVTFQDVMFSGVYIVSIFQIIILGSSLFMQ